MNRPHRRAAARAVLILFLVAPPTLAVAQEMSLDLTDTTDYRPRVAFSGVQLADPKASSELVAKLKLERLSASLVAEAIQSKDFATVLGPAEFAPEALAEARKCAEAACFRALADKLDVNIVESARLEFEDGKPRVQLLRYTRFADTLDSSEARSSLGSRDLERKVGAAFQADLKKALQSPLGRLKLSSSTPGAVATLGHASLGPLPVEKSIPPGKWTLQVTAPGFLTDELEVEIAANQTREAQTNLVQKLVESPRAATEAPLEPAVADHAPSAPLWKRPGTYLVVAGAAALVVGAVFGASAKAIQDRAVDANGDGVLDLSRRERAQAISEATLANVMFAGGGALIAGGVLWVALAPGKPRAAEAAPTEVAGLTFNFAGSF